MCNFQRSSGLRLPIRVQTMGNRHFYRFKVHVLVPFGDEHLASTRHSEEAKFHHFFDQVLGLGNQHFEAPTRCTIYIQTDTSPKTCVSYQIFGEFTVGGYLDLDEACRWDRPQKSSDSVCPEPSDSQILGAENRQEEMVLWSRYTRFFTESIRNIMNI